MKIRKGDTVKVLSGKDRGKTGVVKLVLPKQNKVVVEGVAVVKRHNKTKNTGADRPKGIQEFESPIPVAKVMLVDPKSGKPTRVGFKIEQDKKIRIARKTGKNI